MKNSIFTLLLLFLAVTAQSQVDTRYYYEIGYVHLKNGTTLKGKYIYSANLEKIQVVTNKNTLVLNASEVDYISKKNDKQKPELVKDTLQFNTILPPSKWSNHTQIGLLVGNPDNDQSAPMVLSSSINYNFIPNLSAGLGVGVEFLKETYMPVTLNLMYKFRQTRTSPFAMLVTGYQIPLEDSRLSYQHVIPSTSSSFWPGPIYNQQNLSAKGGLLLNPMIGFISQTSHNVGMSFSLGYRYHRLHYKGSNSYLLDVDYNRLTVNVGLIIH